jgi:hypothetical protein
MEAIRKQMPLAQFVGDFRDSLDEAVKRVLAPKYNDQRDPMWDMILSSLARPPYDAQADVIHQIGQQLDPDYCDAPSAIINADMGTGKTLMGICVAALLNRRKFIRTLVLSPPHLTYKWRREILETIPEAKVTVLNGPDALLKLIALRNALLNGQSEPALDAPHFYVLGRVRMRMGYHTRPAYAVKQLHHRPDDYVFDKQGRRVQAPCQTRFVVACPDCGEAVKDPDGNYYPVAPGVTGRSAENTFGARRNQTCQACGSALWTLKHKRPDIESRTDRLVKALCQLPSVGPATAKKILKKFGEDFIQQMLDDNIHELINLMDQDGRMFFSDRAAKRMEKVIGNLEFNFGSASFQPSEFIKRYLPRHYFGLLIADEAHEYKNTSAQGDAMGVIAACVEKLLMLTGTLIGGYASDYFLLIWRIATGDLVRAGYRPSARTNTLTSAQMRFMRDHGVLKHIRKTVEGDSFRTAKGKQTSVATKKAPGFGPEGIVNYVLPYTAFLRLPDVGQVPSYDELPELIEMDGRQRAAYDEMEQSLVTQLRSALANGDHSLTGVVLNALLAWPECAFREEVIRHPRTRDVLHRIPAIYGDNEVMPKEREIIDRCLAEKAEGRRCIVYSVYTGKRDTTRRLSRLMKDAGLNAVVMTTSVGPEYREEWISNKVEEGIDVLICNPDLVKTGLDLLDFPTLLFAQTGYNVYTVMQAARRSWRIGQHLPVKVYFFGYRDCAQSVCLELMGKKIAVAQSTSGEIPDNGLDSLNTESDSLEIALAKELVETSAAA